MKTPWLRNYPIPKFSGADRERPMMFLNDFERYVSAVDVREYDFHFVIQSCSVGMAREWWNMTRENMINGIVLFKIKFIKRFWNVDVRSEIEIDLHRSYYTPSKLSRFEYAIKMISNARDLIPPPSDREIIKCLSRHFSEYVKAAFTI